jgi:hypothetical protein
VIKEISLAGRKLVAFGRVGGRHVKIERLERATAGVPDLVGISALDQDERSGFERIDVAIDDRLSLASST